MPGYPGWFDLSRFAPGAGREAAGIYLLDEVGSTSDFLLGRGGSARGAFWRRAAGGWLPDASGSLDPPAPGDDLLCAAAAGQTAGRGRMGRRWFGCGLQLSWRLPPPPPEIAPRLSVWTGLVAARTLAGFCSEPVLVKWPNDLFLRGRKLGGVIYDLVGGVEGPLLVGGMGLNLDPLPAEMPDEVGRRAATLAETGAEAAPAAVAGDFLVLLDSLLPRFVAEGWGPFRADFARADALAGRRVEYEAEGETAAGVAAGIDDDGALLLDGPEGRRRLLAGDVHIVEVD